jgi:hypothetical protein
MSTTMKNTFETKYSWLKMAALVLISVGASIDAAGIILRACLKNQFWGGWTVFV